MTYTKEQINEIVSLKDNLKNENLDIFNLGGILYLDDGDYTKGNNRFSAHSLPIDYNDFFWCENEEDVLEQFHESLREAVMEQLL